jgi:hypothetical protein
MTNIDKLIGQIEIGTKQVQRSKNGKRYNISPMKEFYTLYPNEFINWLSDFIEDIFNESVETKVIRKLTKNEINILASARRLMTVDHVLKVKKSINDKGLRDPKNNGNRFSAEYETVEQKTKSTAKYTRLYNEISSAIFNREVTKESYYTMETDRGDVNIKISETPYNIYKEKVNNFGEVEYHKVTETAKQKRIKEMRLGAYGRDGEQSFHNIQNATQDGIPTKNISVASKQMAHFATLMDENLDTGYHVPVKDENSKTMFWNRVMKDENGNEVPWRISGDKYNIEIELERATREFLKENGVSYDIESKNNYNNTEM